MKPAILTAAIVGAETTRDQNPNLPLTPEEIGVEAAKCADEGASVIHLHGRDAQGHASQDKDLFAAAIAEIRGGGSPMSAQIARKVVQSFQATPAHSEAENLSTREREVLGMLSQGFLYKEIAEQTGSSIHTINTHVRRIYEKLHVHSRAQAVAKYRGS